MRMEDELSEAGVLEFQDVYFAYDAERPVLRGVNLSLRAGEKLGLMGGNGSGKTTLLHAAMGLVTISRGRIALFGQTCRSEQDFRPMRGRVGLVFQDADDQLFSPTVMEDVAFGPLNQGHKPAEAKKIALQTLGMLGLEGYENRITYKLSGGEKRLVSLAAVLAMSPEVLLLDEPTLGLDESANRRLVNILQSLPQAMLMVSHDRSLLEAVTSATLQLNSGTIV